MNVPTAAGRTCIRVAAALLVLAFLAALPGAARAASEQWTTFLNNRDVQSVAFDGTGFWIGGAAGALHFSADLSGRAEVLSRSANGLASNLVTAVLVTPRGEVWFGTEGQGISRWNPTTNLWQTIDSTFGLPSSYITSMASDGGYVFVGTRLGFAVLAGDTVLQTCSSLADSCLRNLYVQKVLVGRSARGTGPYYFATQGGVTGYNGSRYVQLGVGLPAKPNVRGLAQVDSTLYCAYVDTVYRLDAGPRWTPLFGVPHVRGGQVDTIYSLVAGGGRLYVGGRVGVRVFDGTSVTRVTGSGGELGNRPRDLFVRSDTIWAATQNGFHRFDGTSWLDVYNALHVDVPARNNMFTLTQEPTGRRRVWMSVQSASEVLYYDPTAVEGSRWGRVTVPTLEGVFSFPVFADRSGYVWIGHCCVGQNRASGSVDILDARGSNPSAAARRLLNPPHNVLSIGQDPAGRMWLGAGDEGDSLYVFNPQDSAGLGERGAWSGYRSETAPPECLPSNVVYTMAFRGNERFLGTFASGLTHWREGNASCVAYSDVASSPRTIAGKQIRSLLVTGDSLWIGTTQGLSLASISRDSVLQNFTADQGLPSVIIRGLAATPDGAVWAGTAAGLVRFKGSDVRVFTTGNSLLVSDAVTGLLVDATSSPYKLWIATSSGVSVYSPATGGGGSGGGGSNSSTIRFFPHPYRPRNGQKLTLSGALEGAARVRIYDQAGRLLFEVDGVVSGAPFWDGRDLAGQVVGSGVYRVSIETSGQVRRASLAVIR